MGRLSNQARLRREIYIALEHLATELDHAIDLVVVEGIHDQETFRRLGYTGPLVRCSKRSDTELVDALAQKYSTVVLLTDFDDEGERINHRLQMLFEEAGMKVNTFYRRQFRRLLHKAQITTIEGIYKIKRTLFS